MVEPQITATTTLTASQPTEALVLSNWLERIPSGALITITSHSDQREGTYFTLTARWVLT